MMKKILLIEDDKWYAESLSRMLDEFEIKITDSAEKSIEIIDQDVPDVICLDLNLGAKNGLSLLHELQSYIDTRKIPIVILSTDARRLDVDNLLVYGVTKILDKTEITPDELKEELNNV